MENETCTVLDATVNDRMCRFWIRRKQRRCSHLASAGDSSGMCSEHSPHELEHARKVAMDAKINHICRSVLCELIQEIISSQDASGSHGPADGSSTVVISRKRKPPTLRVSAPKRMANPFSLDLSPPLVKVALSELFSDAERPIHIDIGCAMGKCLHSLSQRPERKSWNHLGIEIRPNIVQAAMDRIRCAGHKVNVKGNIHFITCNFAHSAKDLFEIIPPRLVRLVTIQFPDPWRRKKHLRRMLVQPELVKLLSDHLSTGAYVYISSDSERASRWMLKCFAGPESQFRLLPRTYDFSVTGTDGAFLGRPEGDDSASAAVSEAAPPMGGGAALCTNPLSSIALNSTVSHDADDGEDSAEGSDSVIDEEQLDLADYQNSFLKINPLSEPSEREIVCEVKWRPVWRLVFQRK